MKAKRQYGTDAYDLDPGIKDPAISLGRQYNNINNL